MQAIYKYTLCDATLYLKDAYFLSVKEIGMERKEKDKGTTSI